MIPKIKKILYATDLSVNSEHAFGYAVNSARKHNAEIVLIHAIDPLPQNSQIWMKLHARANGSEKQFEENTKVVLENMRENILGRIRAFTAREFAKDTEGPVPIADIIVEEGYPAEVILKKMDELQCDIVIMGTHSKGAITQAFLGSVAERVLRRVRKPVFIIPLP